MATMAELEQRLEQVENEVAELKGQLSSPQHDPNWLVKVTGIVKHPSTFAKVLEYGREYREADRPDDIDGESA